VIRALSGVSQSLTSCSNFLFHHQPGKMLIGAIIGLFRILWKATGGKLPVSHVILHTLTTGALVRARLVSAVAFREVLFLLAFHTLRPQ